MRREARKVGVRIGGVRDGVRGPETRPLPHQVCVHELMIRGNLDF